MSEEVNNIVELRKYLLGTLDEAQTKEIEELLVSDEECLLNLEITEDEIIQDFADGKLSEEEEKAFHENFIITDERRKQINFARAWRKLADKESKNRVEKKPSIFDSIRSFFLSPLPAFSLILVIVSVLTIVWWNYPRQSEILAALNKSQKNERPTASRISDFDYAPKKEGTRGKNEAENLDFLTAKAKATEASSKNPTAENFHELGRVFLSENNFDESIKQFEKAVKLNPNIAKLNNDFGAALMEKGKLKEEGKLELFTRANELLEKAIQNDKSLKEAYFNRALIIELLNLQNQSKEAWENYLKLDSSSKWADEAREHLEKLESSKPIGKTKEQILQEFLEAKKQNDKERAWQTLSRNREMITGKLIPQQLAFLLVEAKTKGDEEKAKEFSDALFYIGKLEKEKSGDLYWQDLANYYLTLPNGKFGQLAKAQEEIKSGYELRRKNELKNSIEKFKSAQSLLKEIGNKYDSAICDYWIATMMFQLNEVEKSNSMHLNLAKSAAAKSYKWLATQSFVRLVYGTNSENKYSQSLQYNKEAFQLANQTNDSYNLERILNSFANINRFFGNYEEAFLYSEKALAINSLDQSISRQLWVDYETLANISFAKNYFYSAIEFHKEAEKLANNLSDTTYIQLSNTYLGLFYTSIKDYKTAKIYLDKAINLAESFKDAEAKTKALSIAKISYGNLMREQDNPVEAIKAYKDTIDFANSTKYQYLIYEANKGLLLSYLKQSDEQTVKNQIQAVLEIFRQYRATILEEQNRNEFFDKKQDIYDIAAEYEFDKSNFSAAFDYTEESRSRSLLDLQNSAARVVTDENKPEIKFSENLSEPLKLAQIQPEIPDNAQLLVYSVLPNKTIIWLITKDNVTAVKSEIGGEELQRKIGSYLELITDNQSPDKTLNLSKELHQILISPIKDKLDFQKQLFIIPDKSLFRLPFATLYSDKYLLEELKIAYSPSANIFLNNSKKAKDFSPDSSETLLSIGNPRFNKSEYNNKLSPLPSAKAEAEEILNLYKDPKVLVEKEATKQAVKEKLLSTDVVHFAGHYVVEEKTPLLSALVLAGDKKEEANLANYEIIAQKQSHIRLIVLSACDTGIEKFYQGEGMIGASRAFLAINIPLVVASQWEVDSESTKDLMVRFHQLRKTERLPSIEALRQAQLEMLKNEKFNQPYYWAAFVALGGYAQF
jgi:CHAT domain-containing protein/Tfp pilus assembly protein PilF